MLVRKKRGAYVVRGVVGKLPEVGKPSSSTSGRVLDPGPAPGGSGGGEIGGGEW